MSELVIEILVLLAIAALLGLLLGYLFWGWGQRARISAARAEGAAGARTTVAGESGLRAQLDACVEERAGLEEELEGLRARVLTEERRAETAEAALAAASAAAVTEEAAPAPVAEPLPEFEPEPLPEPELLPEPDPDPVAEPEPEPETVAPETAAAAGPPPSSLLAERPDEVDDLKEIKGVGKVMEGVLNDKGIYLFRQVANFTPADVAWVNEAIEAFPGRIERDNWVGQAQELYRAKYGKAHDEA